MEKEKPEKLLPFILALSIATIYIIIWISNTLQNPNVNPQESLAHFGALIGGLGAISGSIISGFALIFIIKNLENQSDALNQQKIEFLENTRKTDYSNSIKELMDSMGFIEKATVNMINVYAEKCISPTLRRKKETLTDSFRLQIINRLARLDNESITTIKKDFLFDGPFAGFPKIYWIIMINLLNIRTTTCSIHEKRRLHFTYGSYLEMEIIMLTVIYGICHPEHEEKEAHHSDDSISHFDGFLLSSLPDHVNFKQNPFIENFIKKRRSLLSSRNIE